MKIFFILIIFIIFLIFVIVRDYQIKKKKFKLNNALNSNRCSTLKNVEFDA